MTRADNDMWDITESVGATALHVAAARAAETQKEDDPLISDPFAKLFIDAAGQGEWSMFARGTLHDELATADPELLVLIQVSQDYIASRTKFFDDFFLAAADAGIRQVVILAAGLDTRAWRLPWPDPTTVYELDQPRVLEFKLAALQDNEVGPAANHVEVPVDLRQDWPRSLRQAGFDDTAPTAWLAEGILPFLPAAAQHLLFERVHKLSAPGSQIAADAFNNEFLSPERLARYRARIQRIPDITELCYLEDQLDVADWLRRQGWHASLLTAEELLARHNRSRHGVPDDAILRSFIVSSQRPHT